MDSRWFKEDRGLPKQEQLEAIEQSKLALRNSTLMHRRLGIILEEMFAKTLTNEEDFEHPEWNTRAIANASRRKTIREIQTLLQF